MKLCLKRFITLIALVSAFPVFAGGQLTATSEIKKVGFNTGGFFIYADWSNPNGCTRSHAVVLKNTDSNFDKAYSLILSAYMAGKSITGYSDGCSEFDGQTYNTIRGFKYLVVE